MPKTIQTTFALRQKIEDNSDFINKRLTRGKNLQQFRKSYINSFEKTSPMKININIRQKLKNNERIIAKLNNNGIKYSLRNGKTLKQQKDNNYLDNTFYENEFNLSRTPTPVSKQSNTKKLSNSDIARAKLMKPQMLKDSLKEIIEVSDQEDNFPIKRCRTRVITRFFPKNEVSNDEKNIKVSSINKSNFGIKKCRTKVLTRSLKNLSFVPLKKTRTRVLTRFGDDLVKNFA